MKIVHFTSEVSPFSKTGGLADVVEALTKEILQFGHQVIIITPFYRLIRDKKIPLKEIVRGEILIGWKKYPYRAYQTKGSTGQIIYLVEQKNLFGRLRKIYTYQGTKGANDSLRFLFFNLAGLEILEKINFRPEIIHCHDWQTALIPNLLKTKYKESQFFKKTKTIFTIHNLNYQGAFDWWLVPTKKKDEGKGPPLLKGEKIKWINFTKRGIVYADIINTVSERYAQEILTPKYGCGLEKALQARKKDVYGIINGIDYKVHNPKYDKNIYYNYDWNSFDKKIKNKTALQKELKLKVDSEIPMIGMANRLTEQKGFDLIIKILPALLRMDFQIVMVGEGKKEYENHFKKMQRLHPKRIAYIYPFSHTWESKIDAASDMFLLPSRFEPCGISQLKSLRYGSIPIVHKVGGLSDTVTDYNPKTKRGTGFVFTHWSEQDLLVAITRAWATYKRKKEWIYLTWQAMKKSFSWELPAKKYLVLYRKAMRK